MDGVVLGLVKTRKPDDMPGLFRGWRSGASPNSHDTCGMGIAGKGSPKRGMTAHFRELPRLFTKPSISSKLAAESVQDSTFSTPLGGNRQYQSAHLLTPQCRCSLLAALSAMSAQVSGPTKSSLAQCMTKAKFAKLQPTSLLP